jgi:hypothetical protein
MVGSLIKISTNQKFEPIIKQLPLQLLTNHNLVPPDAQQPQREHNTFAAQFGQTTASMALSLSPWFSYWPIAATKCKVC